MAGIAAAIALVVGIGTGWKLGSGHWEGRYQALQAEGWRDKALGEEAARNVVEGQLRDARKTIKTNSEVMLELKDKSIAIDAARSRDRILIDRLFKQTARSCPDTGTLQPPDRQPRTAPARGDASGERFADLSANTLAECDRNSSRLNALIQQILPQL